MAPQTVRLGMADARRVAVVVVICRDVRVGVGALYVEMVTTESAYPLGLLQQLNLLTIRPAVRVVDKTPATISMFRA
jgi:hypothetical protein